jgi:phosphoenolpyruvate carboxykinase (ATP)
VNATLPANTNRHPTSIIFLTCDVTGVIPPISLLTEKQAMTCFLLGYTSKVPGTEVSVREPEVAFSACFGEPFLVWKPERYGELLLQYLRQYPAKVWLLNTGWMGGPATAVQRADGLPRRVPIIDSRRMVRYIQSIGEAEVPTQIYSDFKWQVPTVIPGLGNPDILLPSQVWDDPVKCNQETSKLYRKFQQALHNKFGQDTVDKYWFGIDT